MELILGDNSVMLKFKGGGAEGLKSQKLFFFEPIGRIFQRCVTFPKIRFLIQLRGDMDGGGVSFFNLNNGYSSLSFK